MGDRLVGVFLGLFGLRGVVLGIGDGHVTLGFRGFRFRLGLDEDAVLLLNFGVLAGLHEFEDVFDGLDILLGEFLGGLGMLFVVFLRLGEELGSVFVSKAQLQGGSAVVQRVQVKGGATVVHGVVLFGLDILFVCLSVS